MEKYYSDLMILKLNKASKELVESIAYGSDAEAPEWLLDSISRLNSGIHYGYLVRLEPQATP